MTTASEYDVQSDSSVTSATITAIPIMILVVVIALYVLRIYQFNERSLAEAANIPLVHMNSNASLPGSMPVTQ